MEKMDADNVFKLKLLESCETMNNKKYHKDNDKLTLSCILNIIDGVLEQHGRIMIITTNYPDKLDKALIRPGRIDIKINFTKCTNVMTREILEFFYETKIDENNIFADDKYTPAQLINKCINTNTKITNLIEELKNN